MKKKIMKKNQGNTFIMVIATLSFLAILTAAILVAIGLCYKMKVFDINSRDNFYYLEQAMDEIYAGVGADSMKHLNEAYDDTIEVLVYYDTKSQSYVTMDNDQANKVLKKSFMKRMKEDTRYTTPEIAKTLNSFISNKYDATSNTDGVQLSVQGNVVEDKSGTRLTIQHVILRREAPYSTINTRKSSGQKETFVQTVSTDIVIAEPAFNVNFSSINSDLNDLYEFSFIADLGVEITGNSSNVNISGNLYAASDFYNKDYNDSGKTISSAPDAPPTNEKPLTNYSSSQLKSCNGVNLSSMYSGLYIDGSNVMLASGKLIVPGTIAAMNGAELTISGLDQSSFTPAQVWADNILLGGYSFKNAAGGMVGSKVTMIANAYISDDLELNAKGSSFSLNGEYYGYNYASTDNRTFTKDTIMANKKRTFVSNVPASIADKDKTRYESGSDATGVKSQAHYNSSAIIVNGDDSMLDLSNVSAMYVAGQAYIEMSKKTTSSTSTVKNKDNKDEDVVSYTYNYLGQDSNNYTNSQNESYVEDTSKGSGSKKLDESVQDYRTGEAISVKSNQLAYIPSWAITEESNGDVYLKLPQSVDEQSESLRDLDMFKKTWKDLDKIPIIKTVISGKSYYYFDFSKNATLDTAAMNEFIAQYSELLNATYTNSNGEEVSRGESYGLTNINKYDYFKINNITLQEDVTAAKDTDSYLAYTNSAISVVNDSVVTVKAKSSNIKALTSAAKNINKNELAKAGVDVEDSATDSEIKGLLNSNGVTGITDVTDDNAKTAATAITTKLQSQYKEMKWLLSATSTDTTAVNQAHTINEYEMSPINFFFNYDLISGDTKKLLASGYGIWVSDGDVNITSEMDGGKFSNGHVKGLVICKGDVTFDKDVKSFEGLIVTGSKMKIAQSMTLTANPEILKTILRECDDTQKYKSSAPGKDMSFVCNILRHYQSSYTIPSNGGGIATESTKSISAIQFEDILSYENWMKNVD